MGSILRCEQVGIFGDGVSHLPKSRPNLKFQILDEGGGHSSFHVQAKSEISNFQLGLEG